MLNLQKLYRKFKMEVEVYRMVSKDSRTPKLGRLFLFLAIGYLFFPFDLIPDFIPVLGQLDELVVIPLLIYVALKFIPPELILEYRAKLK